MKHSKKNFSKPVLFLAASLIACQPVSALGVTFSDLDKVPWPGAETSIQKAADLGLMVGETQNGKTIFRPRDKVSLCETVQLAYKLMVNTKKLTPDDSVTEKWSTTMQTYKIPEWAHPALAQCLEKKIVAITDLSSFMNNGAPREATRERATEILGRALEAAVPSLSAGGSTSFGDNAEISESARPYIALLAQQKIVSGDNQGNFNPKNTLNRSETAVLVSNLYTLLVNSASAPETPSEPVEAAKLEGKIGGMADHVGVLAAAVDKKNVLQLVLVKNLKKLEALDHLAVCRGINKCKDRACVSLRLGKRGSQHLPFRINNAKVYPGDSL